MQLVSKDGSDKPSLSSKPTEVLCKLIIASLFWGFAIGAFLGASAALQSDLIAYHTAAEIFFAGGNPYDPERLLEAQEKLAGPRNTPLMVWNPPIIFVVLGGLFSLDLNLLRMILPTISVVSSAVITFLGWRIGCLTALPTKSTSPANMWLYLGCATWLAYPLLWEVRLIQFSSLLSLTLISGMLLLHRRHDLLGGAIMSLALIKPHVLTLPVLVYGLYTLIHRRFTAVASCLTTLFVLFGAAEMINPGITQMWLGNTHGLPEYLGSNTPSFVRSVLSSFGFNYHLSSFVWAPLLIFLSFIVWRGRRFLVDNGNELMLATAFSPFVAPYGFAFDQSYLALVVGYLLSTSSPNKHLKVLGFTLLASLLPLLLTGVRIGEVDISWYTYAPSIFILFVWLGKLHIVGTDPHGNAPKDRKP